jgi:hypothetical protein
MSPIALEFSVFRKLPPELLLYIGSFLLPESALSFSLCCQPIYFTIGKQYLDTLKENSIRSDHRYKFLKLDPLRSMSSRLRFQFFAVKYEAL